MDSPAHPTSGDERDERKTEASGGRPRGRRIRRLAVAALIAVLATTGAYLGWLHIEHHREEVAAAQAIDAATRYALTLSNIDAGTIDKNFADIANGATGEFKNLHAKSAGQLRQILIDNQASARGTVVDAAAKSVTPDKVVVLLAVTQAVNNSSDSNPHVDRSRLRMTMEKVDGQWLASKVEVV
ncbi:Mce protein [Mycobacterium sp.]|uniref:Mce protein n=1 Tax=Mycobacterium sp. TaxID=1785 RepID=UPI0031D723DC